MDVSRTPGSAEAALRLPAETKLRKPQTLVEILMSLGITCLKVTVGYVLLLAVLTAIHFPYQVDEAAPEKAPSITQSYYTDVYAASGDSSKAASGEAPLTEAQSKYVQMAKEVIETERIVPKVTDFVQKYGLQEKRILDVGAGSGYLQDVVKDYVGLDVSSSARRYFHKPFVAASATSMPFRDNEFDAAWSVWVLEHVPKPEQALSEIRRVVKDGGVLYLKPTFACPWWLAQGYQVRPYSDFDIGGKVKKASLNVLASPYYRGASMMPIRWVRKMQTEWAGTPSRLHYTLLEPNYKEYWVADSDAINNLDYYEMLLWFTTRGDECLNCAAEPIWDAGDLVIRIHKK
jgi:SAM-dependent methyltransferase